MKSYKYIGVLTVFLLLMLQNMMAQTPDFSKMTHAQQVEYIKQQKLQAEVLKQKLIKQFNTPPQGTEKKKTGSVFVTFKRTILHSYNETKTSSDGAVNTQSGNSKVNINVNVSTEKVVVSDNGNSFSVTAYGDQQPESVPLQGSGVITDEEEGQTELSNSKSQGSISLDLANSQVSFDYNKDSKKGTVNITGAYSIPTGEASIHYISNTSTGGDISASYMQLLKMIGLTYGQVGVYNYEVMEEAFKHMTPAMIQQSNEGREMSGNGGQCVINVTKKGYEITYTNTATLSKVDDGWTGTNTYTITNQVHMSIGEKPSVLDAILEPDDMQAYNKFMPEGKKVDGSTTKGNTLGFHVRIIDKSDPTKDVSYEHPFTVTYSLVDVSSYPGICMNYPVKDDADTKPDLKWDDQMNAMAHLGSINETTAISKKKEGVSFPAFITSYDYAAYGVLKAHVVLNNDNDLEIEAHFPDRPGETFIRIPKDDNGNKIADEWEEDNHINDKNYPATWDENPLPDNGHPGDQFSLLDEYRGFVNHDGDNDSHIRLSPNTKNIFVINNGGVPNNDVRTGALNFGIVSEVAVHYYKTNQFIASEPGERAKFPRWINFNSPFKKKAYAINVYVTDEDHNLESLINGEEIDHEAEASTLSLDVHNVVAPDNAYFGDLYPEEVNYIYINHKYITDVTIGNREKRYLPDCQFPGNSCPLPDRIIHIEHANNLNNFNPKIDVNTLGTVFKANKSLLISRMVSFTVMHELGHATHRHHHLEDPVPYFDDIRDFSYYAGDKHCPMRYWYCTINGQVPPICNEIYDWYFAFISTVWNPTLLKLPNGKDDFKFCTSGDDCFHQMNLKKPN